jgi:hypothetical protein
MYWLRRPPYLRWLAAGLVVCVGLYLDTRSAPSVAYPFAAAPISIGESVTEIEWREVPPDLLPAWDTGVSGVAASSIPAGTPLVPSLLTETAIPAGWWSISLPVSRPVAPGTPIRVAFENEIAEGLVVGAVSDNGYEVTAPVAFPPAQADLVARIAPNSALVVMIGSLVPVAGNGG